VTTDVGGGYDQLTALVRQPDGMLVAAGGAEFSGTQVFALARCEPDGRLDAAFGTGGIVTTDLGGDNWITALVRQPDNRLVAAGSAALSSPQGVTQVFALARYHTLDVDVLAAFVTEVYLAALARLPDASEVAYWVGVLEREPSPDTVRGMLHVVFDGPEFRQRPVNPWQYVDALYQAMLGREPDQGERDWWVQAVLDRLHTVLPVFLASPEFQRLVPSCRDQAAVTLLVGRLYQYVLRRVASPEELAWWTQDIMTWCALEEAVETFFTTGEYLGVPRTLGDHVTVVYRALLAREPDAGEQAWWVEDLAGQLAALEDDLMASPEFEARVDRLFP
jgi:Domain of unknown function (DUF4214)/Domain of unknown function (DUF5122) beta-propeller